MAQRTPHRVRADVPAIRKDKDAGTGDALADIAGGGRHGEPIVFMGDCQR